jgi:hypothetical protein
MQRARALGGVAGRLGRWKLAVRLVPSALLVVPRVAGPALLRRLAVALPTLYRRAHQYAVEGLVALGLTVLAVMIRDPRYLLTHSFWLDEGWVVDSVRAPLQQLRLVTASTPIGWTLLLRVVPPVGGPERYRVLPLAFAALIALAAWQLGRMLCSPAQSWSWLYGLLCGITGAASAAVLNHTWLKQYTAEAFAAVAIALLLARVERAWSWRSLAMFAAGGTTGFLISNTAPLVSAAGLGGLWLTTITARRLSRLPALAVTTVALGMADGIVYRALANNGNTRAMRSYWRSWYLTLDHGLGDAAEVVWGRFTAGLSGLGRGPWWLALALVVVGLVTLWRARLPAVALTPLAIGVELLALGLARSYPFLEPRTSIFYAALLTVTAAAGLATLACLALRSRATAPLAGVGVLVLGLLLVPGWIRAGAGHIPGENVKHQVADVLAHRQLGDAVLATFGASFSFAYYWPDRPTFVPTTANTAVTFMPTFPDHPDLVLVHQPSSVSAMVQALERAVCGHGRVWVITGSAEELDALRRRATGMRFSSPSGSADLALATDGRCRAPYESRTGGLIPTSPGCLRPVDHRPTTSTLTR